MERGGGRPVRGGWCPRCRLHSHQRSRTGAGLGCLGVIAGHGLVGDPGG